MNERRQAPLVSPPVMPAFGRRSGGELAGSRANRAASGRLAARPPAWRLRASAWRGPASRCHFSRSNYLGDADHGELQPRRAPPCSPGSLPDLRATDQPRKPRRNPVHGSGVSRTAQPYIPIASPRAAGPSSPACPHRRRAYTSVSGGKSAGSLARPPAGCCGVAADPFPRLVDLHQRTPSARPRTCGPIMPWGHRVERVLRPE